MISLVPVLSLGIALLLTVAAAGAGAADADWVRQSNRNAQVLLQLLAKYDPEQAAARGLRGSTKRSSTSSQSLSARTPKF